MYAPTLPVIDPVSDLGVFITRDWAERGAEEGPAGSDQALKEMQRVLHDWGYAH